MTEDYSYLQTFWRLRFV